MDDTTDQNDVGERERVCAVVSHFLHTFARANGWGQGNFGAPCTCMRHTSARAGTRPHIHTVNSVAICSTAEQLRRSFEERLFEERIFAFVAMVYRSLLR
jgi:hypothetical protein